MRVPIRKPAVRRIRTFPGSDHNMIEAICDAAHKGSHGPRDDGIIILLYGTGLRCSELAAINREMLNL